MTTEKHPDFVPITASDQLRRAPKRWSWKLLTDLARLESGHTPSRYRDDWWGGDISWLSLTEIRELHGKWVTETQIRTNSEGIANSAARVLPRGTVCLSRTASVGFVAIMENPMATSQDFANWVCGDDLDPEFLMYALIWSREYLRSIASGATHKTIYMPQLESFHICTPDRPMQEQIVSELKGRLVEVQAARQAAVNQLRYAAALKSRALESIFAGISKRNAIGTVGNVQSGYAFKSDTFTTDGVRLLRNTNILPGQVYWDDQAFLSEEDAKPFKIYELNDGDVLISLDRPIISSGIKVARVGATDLPALLVQRVGRFLIDSERLDPDYLYAYLQTQMFISAISGHDRSLGVPHISPTQVENVEIPLPDVTTQRKLSKQLNEVAREWQVIRSAIQAQLADLTMLPNAILAQAFESS